MAYRYDPDLEFLYNCTANELDPLVSMLIYDKDGSTRYTESLTQNSEYKKFSPNHNFYWKEIAAEIQTFGANTFATLFRGGKGVTYREVLTDVCDKMKVNYNDSMSTDKIEMELLLKILTKSMDNMSEEERKEMVESLKLNTTNLSKEAIVIALQVAVRAGGFMSYQIAVIVANTVLKAILGRGLSIAANAGLTKALSLFAGPVGWAISGIWTAYDVAGPAFRVTIPVVIQIAYMRASQSNAAKQN